MDMTLSGLLNQSPFNPQQVASSLWLIIALPLLGAAACGLFGKRLGRANTHLIACLAVGGAFVLSVVAFWAVAYSATRYSSPFSTTATHYALAHDYGTWFQVGSFRVNFGLSVDHLSGTLLLVVTGVGFLIHLYSTSYMEHDPGYGRYFAYLNLFVAMMLTLVLADSLLLLFIGWEGVGMCSYLLIGFWYTDAAKAYAGRKAFITNRIGDFGFLLATFLLVLWVGAFAEQSARTPLGKDLRGAKIRSGLFLKGPLDLRGLEEISRAIPPKTARAAAGAVTLETPIAQGPFAGKTFGGVLTAVMLLFLLGAAGKSAQLPLYVWLPDAMAGPTPVSALIHAATMVTAGIYLFCRLSFFLVLSPVTMATVALVGGATALFAALIAFAQDDIKKVLAYSTVSQLGLMFLGVGMGVFWAAVFHLVTHAFFKACLFLGAGSVMHGNGDETDIKKLGGLRREMKTTWLTFLVATLAITGIVPLSGFFSKDAILHGVHSTHLAGLHWVTNVAWLLGLATAACTAFYMSRLYLLTFEGERSKEAKLPHAHESARPMTFPLVVLAGLSVVALVHGLPLMKTRQGVQPLMENYLGPVFATANFHIRSHGLVEVHHGGSLWGAWALAWAIALGGGSLAAFMYLRFFPGRAGKVAPLGARLARRWAQDKFYVDEVYDWALIRRVKQGSALLYKIVDELLIDTIAVRGTAWVTHRVGGALRYFQTGDAQTYAAVMVIAATCFVAYVLKVVL